MSVAHHENEDDNTKLLVHKEKTKKPADWWASFVFYVFRQKNISTDIPRLFYTLTRITFILTQTTQKPQNSRIATPARTSGMSTENSRLITHYSQIQNPTHKTLNPKHYTLHTTH